MPFPSQLPELAPLSLLKTTLLLNIPLQLEHPPVHTIHIVHTVPMTALASPSPVQPVTLSQQSTFPLASHPPVQPVTLTQQGTLPLASHPPVQPVTPTQQRTLPLASHPLSTPSTWSISQSSTDPYPNYPKSPKRQHSTDLRHTHLSNLSQSPVPNQSMQTLIPNVPVNLPAPLGVAKSCCYATPFRANFLIQQTYIFFVGAQFIAPERPSAKRSINPSRPRQLCVSALGREYGKILFYYSIEVRWAEYMDIQELIGVTLGTCTLERVIGRGGMGAVFLAQQSRPLRTVALKVLIPSITFDPDQQRIFLARFQREADTVAKLEHKNILPIYEYDEAVVEHQRLAYLVMPFIRGGTLRERIDEMSRDGTRFDLKLVASYISQVADALSYAHSLGVVHRDIKPGNLLFHQDGRLLLSDFGIVRLNAVPSLTTVGSFVGTVEYAAPEQVRAGAVDARSDIYSLGIILYELLIGSVPFSGSNPFAVMTKVLNDPVPSLRDVRPDLSPAIEAVVIKSLAKRPEDRYQSATEMAVALRAAVSAAFKPVSPLRIGGDANNTDVTVSEVAQQVLFPLGAAVSKRDTVGALPPTDPAIAAVSPQGIAPWQQGPSPWQWPSQAQVQEPAAAPAADAHSATSGPDVKTYRRGRRLLYYGVALLALLLQLPIVLLFGLIKSSAGSTVVLGLLAGASINLLILAALGFTAVTRSDNVQRFFYRCLAAALLAPLVSGLLINFGAGTPRGLLQPILAYLVLLISNIFAVRQLARVDVANDQVEVAPILWRPAIVGALTGLLPLTIILVFALLIPSLPPSGSPTPILLSLFISLFIALIGSPTPGAMMAVWLSKKMTFAVLLRSSAIAGMLMFLGAFLLVVLLSLIPANPFLFFYKFSQPWIALLLTAALLGLIGLLRGMLDAWVYQRITRSNKP